MNVHLSALARKSIADVLRRKAHAAVLVMAIMIPVAGLIAVSVAGDSLSAAYTFSLVSGGTRQDVVVAVDRADSSLLADISRQRNIIALQLATVLDTQWHVAIAPGHVDFRIFGYADPRHVNLSPFQLVEGRYPGPGQIVMEYGDLALGTYRIGERIVVDTAHGPAFLQVVGIARTPGENPATSGKGIGYMTTAALDRLRAFGYSPGATQRQPLSSQQISLDLRDANDYQATVQALGPLFRAHDITVLGIMPPAQNAPVAQVEGILALVRALLAVAVLLAAVLVMSAVTALVAEQTAVIGTMKALGGTRARIVRGYWTTVLVHGLAATLGGLALGILVGGRVASATAASIPLAPGPLEVSRAAVALALIVGLVVPLAAAFVPIWLRTRVPAWEALSTLGVRTARATPPGHLSRLLAARLDRLPQTVSLGVRGLLRRPWEVAVSVLTVAVAATTFLVVQSLASSVDGSIASVWGSFRADVEVYVGGHSSFREVSSLLSHVPNVGRIERVGWFGSQTDWGKVGVWGIAPDSTLFRARVTSGRWFTPADTRVCLVSDDLAARAGLRPGSTVTVPGPNGGRMMSLTVIGTVDEPVDDLSQVGTIDLPVNDLYELEGASPARIGDFTNRVLVGAVDRSPAAVDRLTRAIDAAGRTPDAGRAGPIAGVFTFHDEVLRHQRNFVPIYVLLLVAAVVVAVVGALGLADALAASVVDRRREIGLLRSLGASGRRVATVFWIEGFTLSLAAWVVAAAAGVPLAYLFVDLFRRRVMPTDFHFDPLSLVAMIAVTLAIATAAAILPASRASALRTAELLRTG